jgi:phenylpropionate dioxygenase-like ring-hydroxylating dioxygenase large terminal subunit
LLAPADYFDARRHAAEVARVFASSWHFVGTTDDLSRPGDFLTTNLLGLPIVVRNFDGELRALSNVCAHRHCLIVGRVKGNASELRCQYHAWEYDSSGRTTRIPEAKLFAPLDGANRPRIEVYRLSRCGRLLFVNLSDEGPSLEEFFGNVYALCAERFGDDWRPVLALDRDLPVDWKIPVENALEAYHVPALHPQTFKADPGEKRSQHRLEPRRTEFLTELPFAAHHRLDRMLQSAEQRWLRALGETPSGSYRHVHCFPNLLLSFTDSLSFVQTLTPTAPGRSQMRLRQFGLSRTFWPWWKRLPARVWEHGAAWVTRRIFYEDAAIYEQVQRGLQASPHAGILGRCEERIHAFQQWLVNRASNELSVGETSAFETTELRPVAFAASSCGECP